MIRRDDDGAAVQSNQQPWRQGPPDRHLPRSKSLKDSELVGNGHIAPIKQQRKMSLSVKSDTAYISPAKCKKHFIKDKGKSPISVIDAESEPTQTETAQVQRDAAEESTSKSTLAPYQDRSDYRAATSPRDPTLQVRRYLSPQTKAITERHQDDNQTRGDR
jgi:hypothetical protein